jgi:DNA invertase Pin-like site-specific DNA recombinase
MKVAIYCRVSTEDQNNSSQERICSEYCSKFDYQIFRIYKDVISGSKDQRPEFNQLLDDMRSFRFDAIMITKLDRLGRSLQHLLGLIDEISRKGIHLIVVTQHIDTTTSAGKLQFQIMGAFAEFERNLISERTRESRKGNLLWGKRGKDVSPRKKRGGLKKVKFMLG